MGNDLTITYDDIVKVNENIPKVKIHSNDYATVAARVQAFRKLFPMGRIRTVKEELDPIIDFDEDGHVISRRRVIGYHAYVYPHYTCAFEEYLSDGYAEEVEGSSQINKIAFAANCQTSAVGRALGFLGVGSTIDIASAEEVVNAQGYDTISKQQAENLREYIAEKGKDESYICKFHKVRKIEDMTVRQYTDVVKWLG